MSYHKPIRIYMVGLILGVNTLYRLFCFFMLFPMVGKGLTECPRTVLLHASEPCSLVLPSQVRPHGGIFIDEFENDSVSANFSYTMVADNLTLYSFNSTTPIELHRRCVWLCY